MKGSDYTPVFLLGLCIFLIGICAYLFTQVIRLSDAQYRCNLKTICESQGGVYSTDESGDSCYVKNGSVKLQ